MAIGLVVVALSVFYFWISSERERQLEVQQIESETLDVESTVIEEQGLGEMTVRLFVYNPGAVSPDSQFLRPTTRTIYQTDDDSLKARQIVNQVLKETERKEPGPESTYPERSRLRNLYILEDGTAVVDLSAEVVNSIAGGVIAELALIQSLTRSLRANVASVSRVRFLVNGKTGETLAGHISITEPFR